MNKNIANPMAVTMLLLAMVSGISTATTIKDRLTNTHQRLRWPGMRSVLSLMFSVMLCTTVLLTPASAASGDFSLDFVAAAPYSYDHTTGGGAFDDRTVGTNADIVESLEGGDFSCGDIVTYFVQVTVDDTSSAATDAPQTIEMNFSFLMDTTGQSGVAIDDITYVGVNYGTIQDLISGENTVDDGIIDDGGSVATLINETQTGPAFTSGSELHGTVELTDLEPGEQVVVRIDVRLHCQPGSSPTGNLQADLQDVRLTYINGDSAVTPPQAIPGGAQTIPFKQTGDIIQPSASLTLLKQISNSSTGPWSNSITVPGGSDVYYNFTIMNDGNVELSLLSINDSLVDTSGITPPLPSTLAPGDSYSGIVGPVTAETLAGTYPNTATANGTYSGETITSDPSSAEYIVAAAPAYTIDKIVTDVAGKGPDGNVTADGDVISYQIMVNNTGNVNLTNITLADTLISVANITGPTGDNPVVGVLEVGESWVFTGSYTATQADINNNGGGDGDIDNTATVDSDELEPLSDSEDVPVTQSPAYTIDKIVTDVAGQGPDGNVTAADDVISYQITINNTGNVDLTNVTVTDPLLGTLTGPTESKNADGILEVGESWVFTGTYTVTAQDINNNGGGDGDIDNTATVDSDELEPLSDSEDVPVILTPTAQITPTGTTCQQYSSGTAENLTQANYNVDNKTNSIKSVAPGVMFYYSTITVPAGGTTTISVDQSKDNSAWPYIKIQDTNQVILYGSGCTKIQGTSATESTDGKVTLTANNLPAGTYVLSVKYSLSSLQGFAPVIMPYPTVKYTFETSLNGVPIGTSEDSIDLLPKLK